MSTYLSFNLNLSFCCKASYNNDILFYKKNNQMSTRIKQKHTLRFLAILCFPLSGVLLFDESESSFIRFSTAVSLESFSSIFEVKTFC